jgi:hypothetical protein
VCTAIISGRKYTIDDFPFLNDVFLISADFRQVEYPVRLRSWMQPSSFRYIVADRIVRLLNHGDLMNDPNLGMLTPNPKGWFEKHFPGEAETIIRQTPRTHR